LSGVAIIGVGIVLDLIVAVSAVVSALAGHGLAAELASLPPFSVLLFIVGAALIYNYTRVVRRGQ
jgi:hypothetical protein